MEYLFESIQGLPPQIVVDKINGVLKIARAEIARMDDYPTAKKCLREAISKLEDVSRELSKSLPDSSLSKSLPDTDLTLSPDADNLEQELLKFCHLSIC
ncbi:unnamed protein product [Microthlaspi erraticum]|uniref:Uncharacterized protein n=1 Tax=Microthlaspi erraticum TaxID=1685480 RepID=A0A6D2IVC1_9BRAS|nr:unnamed protein product [Microthlaspi erraticum]